MHRHNNFVECRNKNQIPGILLRVSNKESGVSLLVEVFAPIILGFQRIALTAPYANLLQIRRSTIYTLIGDIYIAQHSLSR